MSNQNAETTIKEQIMECEKKLLDYGGDHHLDDIDELLHDNLLFNVAGGQTLTKDMLMEIYRSGNMSVDTFFTSDYMIHLIDNNAIVSHKAEMSGKFFDQDVNNEKLHYIRVWKLCKGKWKVIAAAQSPI